MIYGDLSAVCFTCRRSVHVFENVAMLITGALREIRVYHQAWLNDLHCERYQYNYGQHDERSTTRNPDIIKRSHAGLLAPQKPSISRTLPTVPKRQCRMWWEDTTRQATLFENVLWNGFRKHFRSWEKFDGSKNGGCGFFLKGGSN